MFFLNEFVKNHINHYKNKGYEILSDKLHHYFWMGKVTETRADLIKIDSISGEKEVINIPIDIFNNFISLKK